MKIKALLYCTKAKPYLIKNPTNVKNQFVKDYWLINKLEEKPLKDNNPILNGKIVAECDFEVEKIEYSLIVANNKPYHYYEPQNIFVDKFYEKSCLNHQQVEEYLGYKNGYAIHIKNLHIFDEPRFIQDYSKNENPYNYIENAPQNMMYAYDNEGNKYVLISIRPEWLCKILNGEKTIEVRKKVLKGMLKNE